MPRHCRCIPPPPRQPPPTNATTTTTSTTPPLERFFNGEARSAFDRFKADVDGIATELQSALASVLAGVDGMNKTFNSTVQNQALDMGTLHNQSHIEPIRLS